MAGCLLSYAAEKLRIYTIEEGSREWQLVKRDQNGRVLNSVIHTRTRLNEKDEAQNIDQEKLVKAALRFNPDIIAPGEIRGRESFEVMSVSNTGHTVITTTHSNGTLDTPSRIISLAKKAYDMLLMFLSLLWVKICSLEVGENFVALPALPGRPRTICQRREKKQTCPQQLRSLLRDSHQASAALPAGVYRTLTHEAVLKRMVRFHCSGGSAVPTQTLAYGGLVAQPTAPARTGYTFTGWYADSALSKAWSFATDTIQDDMTLYAKWEPVTCTVSFYVNGGSDVPTQTVTYGELAARPMPPTRTGYTFAEWYADSSLSKAWSFSEDTVLTNTTLYAKWVAAALSVSSESGDSNSGDSTSSDNLTVTFDSAGGSTISAQLVRYGQLLEKPPVNPEKAGYTFAGWYTDPDYTHGYD